MSLLTISELKWFWKDYNFLLHFLISISSYEITNTFSPVIQSACCWFNSLTQLLYMWWRVIDTALFYSLPYMAWNFWVRIPESICVWFSCVKLAKVLWHPGQKFQAERFVIAVVQSLSYVRLFATLRTTAHQASLSFTISRSLLKFMSIKLVMLSNHLILAAPFSFCLQSFPASGSFSMSQCIRWPKCWSFSFSISPSSEYSGLTSFRMDWMISLQYKGLSRVFSSTTVCKYQFFGTQSFLLSNSHEQVLDRF